MRVDRLFRDAQPDAGERNFLDNLNPDSLQVLAGCKAERSLAAFQDRLTAAGYGTIATEISPGRQFYYAEVEHQQYLHKNPDGYCPNHATGVRCGPRR